MGPSPGRISGTARRRGAGRRAAPGAGRRSRAAGERAPARRRRARRARGRAGRSAPGRTGRATAISGPSEKPAVMANAARRPRRRPRGRDSSPIHALATLNTTPLTTPCRNRAPKSSAEGVAGGGEGQRRDRRQQDPREGDATAAQPVRQRPGDEQGGHQPGGVAAEQGGEHLRPEVQALLVDQQQRGRDVRTGRDGEQREDAPPPGHRLDPSAPPPWGPELVRRCRGGPPSPRAGPRRR